MSLNGLANKVKAFRQDSNLLLSSLLDSEKLLAEQGNALNAFIRTYPTPDSIDKLPDRDTPLFGLKYAVKDNISVLDAPLSLGLRPSPIKRSFANARIVKELNASGAILVASTNLDELALGDRGINSFYGNVVNPYDSNLICGGSSAGSAAAVAAKIVDFAIGTDFGGSIRIPAAACHVAGLKSSLNLSNEGIFSYSKHLDSVGFIANSVADLNFLVRHVSEVNADQLDTTQIKDYTILCADAAIMSFLDFQTKEDYTVGLSLIKNKLSLKELNIDIDLDNLANLRKILSAKAVYKTLTQRGFSFELLPSQAKALWLYAESLAVNDVAKATESVFKLKQALNAKLKDNCFLVTPTLPYTTPKCSDEESSTALNVFLILANLCALPALTLPHPKHDFSWQLIGAEGSDLNLLNMGSCLEAFLAYSS